MAKKKKPLKKKKLAHIKITEREHLERMIKISENNISGKGGSIDELFAQQAARLKKELEGLRKTK